MKTFKWGILGAGRIARKFASDLKYVEGARLYAVGARTRESAHAFATEFPGMRDYEGYEALVNDPEVDAIYVATPHGLHHEHVLLCLNHKKPVLCEKAFAINLREAREMVDISRRNNVFLMEAFWTKFLPHYQKMRSLIDEGKIGKIRSVLVNFGFKPYDPIPERLFDPALGGGTLLDIGIYNVFLALSLLGRPDEIFSSAELTPGKVDTQCSVIFKYAGGEMAHLFSSFHSELSNEGDICGEHGRIRLGTRFFAPDTSIEYYSGKPDTGEMIPFDKEPGYGYQYEARHVQDCLEKGLPESPVMSLDDTLLQMETLDRIRKSAGIVYPHDL
ncbi:MAG: Gfo/Idh/MocA family oxidoreductase [Chitinophagaceae bacterium]|nr:MAG: Gfo/Idh/MocA family oxidoreductase [Chitinophagaceae bacterium]